MTRTYANVNTGLAEQLLDRKWLNDNILKFYIDDITNPCPQFSDSLAQFCKGKEGTGVGLGWRSGVLVGMEV